MIKAILLMGGSGERFGSSLPKQFHHISGKKIYLHTLERFLKSALFDEVILVCHPDWMDVVKGDVGTKRGLRVIPGGKHRQESSYLGLLACGDETSIVVIHDAVRPFVARRILEENVEGAKRFGAVDTCIPSADTLVHAPDGENIAHIPHRSEYLRGQTPQSFAYPLILRAHEATAQRESTDDCRLALEQGHPVHVVSGDEINMKVTTELDLALAEQLFLRMSERSCHEERRSLRGLKIAVTGGTGGIGQAVAAALQKEGAEPIVISRKAPTWRADLSSFEETKKIFTAIGPLDGLINCVGLLHVSAVSSLSSEDVGALIDVNLKGVIYACQCAELKSGGHIINFASSSYSRGRKGFCIYSATKAAVVNFTQGLAEERPELCINAIAPQRTNTAMRTTFFPNEDPSLLLAPESVAEEAIALLKQSDVTGSVIEVRHHRTKPISRNLCSFSST